MAKKAKEPEAPKERGPRKSKRKTAAPREGTGKTARRQTAKRETAKREPACQTMSPAQRVEEAHRILRADYYQDVRGLAQEIKDRLARGDFEDSGQLYEALDQAVDGSRRVMITAEAMDALRYSDHDDAALDEMGADSFDWTQGVPWSQLAFFAFRADVLDDLAADGVDLADPMPEQERVEAPLVLRREPRQASLFLR